MNPERDNKIAEILVNDKKLKKKRLDQILQENASSDKPLEQLVVEAGDVSRADLLSALSTITGCPSVDLSTMRVSASTAQTVPQSMAKKFNLICLKKSDGRIQVAMADPHDTFAIEYVKMRTGLEVEALVGFIGDILKAQDEAYKVTIQYIDASTPTGAQAAKSKEREREEAEQSGEKPKFMSATRDKPKGEDSLLRGSVGTTTLKVNPISLGLGSGPVMVRSAPPSNEMEAYKRLLEIGNALTSTLDSNQLFQHILHAAAELTGSEGASLILIGEGGNDLYFKESLGPRSEDVKRVRFPLDEHSLAGFAIQNRKMLRVNDVRRDPRHSKVVDEAVQFTTKSLLVCPVIYRGEPLGVIEAINKTDPGGFTDTDEKYMEVLCGQAAIALQNAETMGRLTNFFNESVEILIEILEKHDRVSRHHLIEVARISTAMGRELGLSPPEIERLCYAGLLHDIGKVKCADPDDPAHAEVGARMLERVKIFREVSPIVRHHHERYNGTGTPDGLKEEEIPRLARVLAVAEAWVEAVSDKGADRNAVLTRMRGEFGTRFDPALRPAFENAVAR